VATLLVTSIGFQVGLRFNPHLNSWTLTFWRSLLQILLGPLFLCSSGQKLFGPAGSRLKLMLNVSSRSGLLFTPSYYFVRLAHKKGLL
jgi:hypothetical protein